MDFRATKVQLGRQFKHLDLQKAVHLVNLYREAYAPLSITRVGDDEYIVRVYVWKEKS